MKNIKNVTATTVAVTLLFLGSMIAICIVDDAYGDYTGEHVEIQLGADLIGTTITVNQYDVITFNEYLKVWYGGWFNTKYTEKYVTGKLSSGADQSRTDIPDAITITEQPGEKTIHFSYGYYDHGITNAQNAHTVKHHTFTLNVLATSTVQYKSNTQDFIYDWVDYVNEGSSVTVRDVSNTVTGTDFIGWNTKANGTGAWYFPGDLIYPPSTTLYAQWREKISVTSSTELILDKGSNVDYTFTFNQSDVSAKIVDKGQLNTLNLSNGKLTGIVDIEPGKYTVKFQIEKGIQKSDFFLTVYVKIYELEPIEEFVHTGEGWIRNIELMPNNVTYNLVYGSITKTVDGVTENISSSLAGLSNLSGTTVSGTFTSPGTYVINITVSAPDNPELKPTNVQIKVLVEDPLPTTNPPSLDRAVISKSDIPGTYDFFVVNPSDYLQIVWTFGDGQTATGHSVVHHYDYPGQYEWMLTLKAFEGYDDVVLSGSVISTGPKDIPVDAWIGVKYAVMVDATASSILQGPDFLSSSIIVDDATGDVYMLVTGTPDAENWADKTGILYNVRIVDGDDIIAEWSLNLHGVSDDVPTSAFMTTVSDNTVTVRFLGSANAVIYVAWDGKNFVRLSGITGTYTYEDYGNYVRPVIVTLGGTQISDTISFEIKKPEEVAVRIGVLHDVDALLDDRVSVPVALYPYGASVIISGANWLSYSGGKIVGTPDLPGTYTVAVTAVYGSSISETQTFTVNVTVDMTDSSTSSLSPESNTLVYVILAVIAIFAILTVVTRAAKYGIVTAILFVILGVVI